MLLDKTDELSTLLQVTSIAIKMVMMLRWAAVTPP